MRKTKLDRIGDTYTKTAIIVFTTVALFILLNVFLYGIIQIGKQYTKVGPMQYSMETLQQAYPGKTPAEINKLLGEMWIDTKFEYEPYTQYRIKAYNGTYFTMDTNGFRHGENQCPYPPPQGKHDKEVIFVFGGSTIEGIGVANDETIASRIQAHLGDVCVYNFGRAGYVSSQERVLFQQLLLSGVVPDKVIFINGLNEYLFPSGNPSFTPNLRKFMEGSVLPQYILERLPVMKVINYVVPIQARFSASQSTVPGDHIVERYFANVQMNQAVADAYHVKAYFFIQPVPTYKYNLTYHLFAKTEQELLAKYVASTAQYTEFHDIYLQQHQPNVFWFGDLQENKTENLYVDQVHYTAAFSDEIAQDVVAQLRE